MKKVFLLFLTCLIISVFLSSCSLGEGFKIMYSSDDKLAKDQFSKVIESIENKDAEELKALFSKVALTEATDIDDQIDKLFSCINTEVVSWKKGPLHASENISYGKQKYLKIDVKFELECESDKYMIFMRYFPRDVDNPDNEGIYTFRIIKSENKEKEFSSMESMAVPGIWIGEM